MKVERHNGDLVDSDEREMEAFADIEREFFFGKLVRSLKKSVRSLKKGMRGLLRRGMRAMGRICRWTP